MLEIACIVRTGIRPKNDDRVAVNNSLVSQGDYYTEDSEEIGLIVVCDGVGGEAFGDKAAEIVTEYFSLLNRKDLKIADIGEHISRINNTVTDVQKEDVKYSKMATTVAGLYINGDDFFAFNVGDTRIYRYRSYISQISKDHTLRQEQLDFGLTPKTGTDNVITRCIGGTNPMPEIVDGKGRVFVNDLFILCTDGIWGVLKDEDFEEVLSKNEALDKSAKTLMELAVKKKSQDNLSIVIVRRR